MRVRSMFVATAGLLLLSLASLQAAAAQPPLVGCSRPSLSTTRVSYGFAPSLATYPGLFTTVVLANGVSAFFPEQVEITTVTNLQGVEGLARVTVHSTITGDRTLYVIPDWLLRAYGGNTGRIIADVERGLLRDVGPCV